MDWGVIVRNVILGLTLLSCGGVTWLAVSNIRAAWRTKTIGPIFYASARLGLVLAVGLVGEAVLKTPELPVDVRTVLYVVALLMVAVGYSGVLIYERKRPHQDKRAT